VSEEAVEETLCDALSDPAGLASRATAALQLARGPLSPAVALAPLVAWMAKPTRHPRGSSLLVDAARESREAASAGARAEAAVEASARAEAEVELKRQEVTRLNGQVQDLIEVNTRLSRAIDEVAGFKREAIAVLGGQSERAHRTLREAEREVGLLRADLEKKSAELLSMDELRARLEHDVENLRKEVVKLRQRGLFGRA
jgi:DNA repair exonuclease SbcCD ATPase subunit